MDIASPEDQKILDVLRSAVAETLERKRRLGQYAVIWRDGKPEFIGGEDAPKVDTEKLNRQNGVG